MIGCRDQICRRYVTFQEENCVVQDFRNCDICDRSQSCERVVTKNINCVQWKCEKRPDGFEIATESLGGLWNFSNLGGNFFFTFCNFYSLALNILGMGVFLVYIICAKCRPSEGGCCGFLSDGYPAVDFGAEEVNEDQNDDGCPSNSIQNEIYVSGISI